MRFKLDENLPTELAGDLRRLGHAADTVADEGLCGSPDQVVLPTAAADGRVLLTMDKGIADVRPVPGTSGHGVVLLRPGKCGRGAVLAFSRHVLPTLLGLDLPGHRVVVTARGIRVRKQGSYPTSTAP
jgi:predicted nuclease of predicted toxin-antitoxin system